MSSNSTNSLHASLQRLYRSRIKPVLAGVVKRRYQLRETGFYGDRYLIRLAEDLLQGCDSFVETGSNVGSTLRHVARSHTWITCLSCEPDDRAYARALRNTQSFPNISLYNEPSQTFLERLRKMPRVLDGETFWWLDAHDYGFEWPLRHEIAFITRNCNRAFVLIDDCLVPGLDCFGYDRFEDQVCSYDYIRDSLNPDRSYRVYHPA